MAYVKDDIAKWATMKFSENPYGARIPDKYLYDSRMMRKKDRFGNPIRYRNLSELMQDGYAVESIFNSSKEMPWEKEETISFSEVFHKLVEKGKMCPSNYVVAVINELDEYDIANNKSHNDEFYRGTIARALRCLASYIRERCLEEILDNVLIEIKKQTHKGYYLAGASVEEDTQRKTDILLLYNSKTYRIWSYQTTLNGISKTSSRVLKANGRGYNVLFPFNLDERVNVSGWFLYDAHIVEEHFKNLIINNNGPVLSHREYCEKVRNNPAVISTPAIFMVD